MPLSFWAPRMSSHQTLTPLPTCAHLTTSYLFFKTQLKYKLLHEASFSSPLTHLYILYQHWTLVSFYYCYCFPELSNVSTSILPQQDNKWLEGRLCLTHSRILVSGLNPGTEHVFFKSLLYEPPQRSHSITFSHTSHLTSPVLMANFNHSYLFLFCPFLAFFSFLYLIFSVDITNIHTHYRYVCIYVCKCFHIF